jgi:hypothetical protein
MATQSFSAVLERLPIEALWTILVAPFNVYEVFGQRDIVPVRGTLNGQPFRASLRPLLPEFRGTQRPLDGDCHFIMVNKKMNLCRSNWIWTRRNASWKCRPIWPPHSAPMPLPARSTISSRSRTGMSSCRG